MMKTMVALMCGILLLGSTGPAVALELPPDVLADQYLLEATEAFEQGDPQTALWAFEQIEVLDTEPPEEFLFFYGKLLVEHGTTVEDVRKGESLLKQFVINVEKASEHYRPTLKLLSVVRKKLEESEKMQPAKVQPSKEDLNAKIMTLTERAKMSIDAGDYTLLTFAISEGYTLDVIAELIARGAKVNDAARSCGRTALRCALYGEGRSSPQLIDMVRLLLDHGADPSLFGLVGCDTDDCVKVAELLLDHGASVDEIVEGNTPLMWAAVFDNYKMVKFLIERGANIHIKLGGSKPLDVAIEKNHTRIIQLLMAHNASSAWAEE